MKIEERVYREAVIAAFDNYRPTNWGENLKVMVFDTLTYNVREFGIVMDKEKILYYGYNISEAYWSVFAPIWQELIDISYIKDYETDNYIFFDEDGRELNDGYTFTQVDNAVRKIIAKSIDGNWYLITKHGPRIWQE